MRLKAGVDFEGVSAPIWYALGILETICREFSHQLVVTSLTDGKHMPGSLHSRGLAADIRTREMSATIQKQIVDKLKHTLDYFGYDVVLEKDHIHLEYDPKVGESWMSFE